MYKRQVIKPEQGLDLTQIALDTASRIDAIIRQHIFEKGTLIVDRPLKDRLVGDVYKRQRPVCTQFLSDLNPEYL